MKATRKYIESANARIVFRHDIEKVVERESRVFVLLSVPEDTGDTGNVYCLDNRLNILWKAETPALHYPDTESLPFKEMSVGENFLLASDSSGTTYVLDKKTGRIQDRVKNEIQDRIQDGKQDSPKN